MNRNPLVFDATRLAFHKGTNTTIRRFGGGFYPDECTLYKVDKKGNHQHLYDGRITSIQIFKFADIPVDLLEIHHLGKTKDPYYNLFKTLKEYYPNFRPEEIVQVISFKVYFNRSDALDQDCEIPF